MRSTPLRSSVAMLWALLVVVTALPFVMLLGWCLDASRPVRTSPRVAPGLPEPRVVATVVEHGGDAERDEGPAERTTQP